MADFKQIWVDTYEAMVNSDSGVVTLLIHCVNEPGISLVFTPKLFDAFHRVIREASIDLDAVERVREMRGK